MQVKTILLCEATTPHSDGTFSLLRGGIDNWTVPSFPTQIAFSGVIVLELSSTEVNRSHVAELDIIDADGNRIMPQVKIPFTIPSRANFTSYKFNLRIGNSIVKIPKVGSYSLHISVDGHNLDYIDFRVMQAPQPIQQVSQ